jgi:hypothetical protein
VPVRKRLFSAADVKICLMTAKLSSPCLVDQVTGGPSDRLTTGWWQILGVLPPFVRYRLPVLLL